MAVELTFTLTDEDAQVIINALGELKLKDAIGVFNKLQLQAKEQLKEDDNGRRTIPVT